MGPTKSASIPKKSKDKGVKRKKTKSSKKSNSTSTDASISDKNGKSNRKDEETGGLKLLKRHCVTMSRISRRKSLRQKKVVLFNAKGTPCGKVAKEMQSYIGVLARRKIPIIRTTWRTIKNHIGGVTAEEKEKIWLRVQGAFEIGPEKRKIVLESAASKWREFKSRLTRHYIMPYLDDPESLKFPPDDYRFINKDHWTQFVAERTNPQFIEVRRLAQARRAKNKYPHRMSRKGYAGLEEELSTTMEEDEIDRATLWIAGRQTKQGTFKDEGTKQCAEKIRDLKEKVASGELSTSGSNDVLTLALGTPEHGGRVRGVGAYVNPSSYFHTPKRRRESIQETIRISVQKILEEQKDKIIEEAKQQAIKEERAFWVHKLAQLEAKVDAREVGKVASSPAMLEKYILHGSGQGSCSQTAGPTCDEDRYAQVQDEVLNVVDGKAIQKALVVIEEKAMECKNKVSKRKECDGKFVFNSNKKDELSKLSEHEKKQVADHGVEGQLAGEKVVQGVETSAKFALGSVDHIVALGTVMEHNDPSQLCHGYPLGDNNLRVSVSVAIEENALVQFSVGDEIRTVRQAMGSWVPWPKELVIMSPVKKPERRRKKESGAGRRTL
ncbi:uncharacterized protein LOC112184961 [Rosa chinensis]|uniref:uncharacterized protein LOC112184961 n=1 Tax=Rosa chinensis TaxID=74649 RepID=UPI000D097144|nr:uncharacterized protein LOC112184961 [Rosa chinensis]XP_040369216.1 uncharacterized protein LOC112184961 [Rosa chinensis]